MRYAKTNVGMKVLQDRSVPLTARQRAAFVLCDAKHTSQHVRASVHSMGGSVEDLQRLHALGLITELPDADEEEAARAAQALKDRPPQQRYSDAYPIASRLTATLGLRGFTLNLAVEHAGDYDELCAVAARIREAVGDEAYAPLQQALFG